MIKRDMLKYIAAFVMGDAGVYYSGSNCRLITNSVEKDYILWKQGILENLTSVNYRCHVDHRSDYCRKPIHILTTKSHPTYTQVRNRVYVGGGYKGIDPHFLKWMDWEMLAILFMDDGSCSKDKRCDATPSAKLNTKRLSYGDSWLLKKGIRDALDIEFNVHRDNNRYFLTLRSKDYETFKAGVLPYVLPCYQYKLL